MTEKRLNNFRFAKLFKIDKSIKLIADRIKPKKLNINYSLIRYLYNHVLLILLKNNSSS